jgi:hypothetical protein
LIFLLKIKEDVKISMISWANEEYRLASRRKEIKSELIVGIGHMVGVIDPEILRNLTLFFEVGGYYTGQKMRAFSDYMRSNSFWPDFD